MLDRRKPKYETALLLDPVPFFRRFEPRADGTSHVRAITPDTFRTIRMWELILKTLVAFFSVVVVAVSIASSPVDPLAIAAVIGMVAGVVAWVGLRHAVRVASCRSVHFVLHEHGAIVELSGDCPGGPEGERVEIDRSWLEIRKVRMDLIGLQGTWWDGHALVWCVGSHQIALACAKQRDAVIEHARQLPKQMQQFQIREGAPLREAGDLRVWGDGRDQ